MPPTSHVCLLRENKMHMVIIEIVIHLGRNPCNGGEISLLIGEPLSFLKNTFEISEIRLTRIGHVPCQRNLPGTDELLRVDKSLEGITSEHGDDLLGAFWDGSEAGACCSG